MSKEYPAMKKRLIEYLSEGDGQLSNTRVNTTIAALSGIGLSIFVVLYGLFILIFQPQWWIPPWWGIK